MYVQHKCNHTKIIRGDKGTWCCISFLFPSEKLTYQWMHRQQDLPAIDQSTKGVHKSGNVSPFRNFKYLRKNWQEIPPLSFLLVTPSWLEILLISLVTHSVFSDQKTFYKFLVLAHFYLFLHFPLFFFNLCHINENFCNTAGVSFKSCWRFLKCVCWNQPTNERQMFLSVKCGWSQIERLVKPNAKASSD